MGIKQNKWVRAWLDAPENLKSISNSLSEKAKADRARKDTLKNFAKKKSDELFANYPQGLKTNISKALNSWKIVADINNGNTRQTLDEQKIFKATAKK